MAVAQVEALNGYLVAVAVELVAIEIHMQAKHQVLTHQQKHH